jgi:hypothetical protein
VKRERRPPLPFLLLRPENFAVRYAKSQGNLSSKPESFHRADVSIPRNFLHCTERETAGFAGKTLPVRFASSSPSVSWFERG